eukprot:superscaffoldBa00000191_g2556
MEMLTLSLCPFCLLREFPAVVIGWVYIPPGTDTKVAVELVAKSTSSMLTKYPKALVFIVGNFNSCRLDGVLPSSYQYVDAPTRKDNILDLCYYIQHLGAPPLGFSDHNVVFLLQHYNPELKCFKSQIYCTIQWLENGLTGMHRLSCLSRLRKFHDDIIRLSGLTKLIK